jgi:hypothetical protein
MAWSLTDHRDKVIFNRRQKIGVDLKVMNIKGRGLKKLSEQQHDNRGRYKVMMITEDF